jgi:predicted DNA-binding protein
MVAMAADQFIAARVSSETKDRLKALAHQRQVSESALLKHLLELTLGAAEPSLACADPACKVVRAARLYVRLRPDDQLLLASARCPAHGDNNVRRC